MHAAGFDNLARLLFKKLWTMVLLVFLLCNVGYAQDSKETYYRGIEAAKSQDLDSAFMYFQLLLSFPSELKYRQDALFATGEYYFAIGDYRDANSAFMQLIRDYPDYKGKLFALAYLFKIAEKQDKESLAKSLENKIIIFKRSIFLFKDSQDYKYKSPLCKEYKVIYYIDKVEFSINGKSFAQISY